MKIRTRLTLWYALILFVSVLLIGGFSYKHFADERRHEKRTAAVSEFIEEEMEGWDDLLSIGLWCGLPAAFIGLAGGWFLMRKALAPISDLTSAAERIHEGNLNQKITRTNSGDEIDRLTEVFNQMTGRLDASFNRVREFTLHASHELKTPLTVLRGEMETALREEHLQEPQKQQLVSQIDEVDRLTKIVDGLTLLTKADAGQIVLKSEEVRFDEIVRDAVEDAKMLAEPAHVQVCLSHCDEVTLQGDRHRLRQVLLNLLDNAIKYNHVAGTVTAELRRSNNSATLLVSNTGPGIPAEKLSRVFDRFFRVDESHGNHVDGCGLGLSIAQWIVIAHGGTIEVTSMAQQTQVAVSLPLRGDARNASA